MEEGGEERVTKKEARAARVFSGATGLATSSGPGSGLSYWPWIQSLKKLSQCLAALQRLMQHKSNKLHNNLKIIYVIL